MRVLWQSIDEPNVALMPEMKLKNSDLTLLVKISGYVTNSDTIQLQVQCDGDVQWSSGGFSTGRFEFINIPDESKVTVMALTPEEGARDGAPSCHGYLFQLRFFFWHWCYAFENQRKIQDMLNMMNSNRPTNANGLQNDGKRGHDLSVFSYASIAAATCNFSDKNKLGQGGFGPVYKGKFVTGQEIAVKRLSKRSAQGVSEFKNELIIIYGLQHTNLVQLFGFCLHGEERMLIYEFNWIPSSQQLDWDRRFRIIEGIAQGLLYLHKYSRTRIIHRDLKASNVLLDERMNPKISDFGMARIFANDEEEANTMKIVRTRGYMSPEYVMVGNFSTKSDVYSFGVLMLEILSGRKNNSFYNDDRFINLVGYAWALWREGAGLGLMDPTIGDSCDKDQMLRCIHVVPTKPAFCTERNVITAAVDGNRPEIVASVNGISISDFDGR
ncbi:hypothetical protein ACLB2K_028649 [Fragaria x ananassa]